MELEKERQEILEKGLYFRLNLTGKELSNSEERQALSNKHKPKDDEMASEILKIIYEEKKEKTPCLRSLDKGWQIRYDYGGWSSHPHLDIRAPDEINKLVEESIELEEIKDLARDALYDIIRENIVLIDRYLLPVDQKVPSGIIQKSIKDWY